jgi:hypothetical protein
LDRFALTIGTQHLRTDGPVAAFRGLLDGGGDSPVMAAPYHLNPEWGMAFPALLRKFTVGKLIAQI